MDHEVYKGCLSIPISGKLLLKKSWQQKYCYLYKASKFGIQRLEIWDGPDAKCAPPRIITLENCIKIQSDGADAHFTVTTRNSPTPYEFNAPSNDEKDRWVSAFQIVAFPDDLSQLTIEEDNDLYCSFGEGVFNVKIHPSSASNRCKLDPNNVYTIYLTSTAIQLKNTSDGALLFTWPYCFIRRYGYKSGKFTFEAGRKCDSGEGTFFVEHPNQQEIFRCLASKMKSMKKLLKEDSSPILDCGDNQFQAALSMEARSRSPLPPSPTSSTTLHDFVEPAEPKPKPVKPPRKHLPVYEPVAGYDKVQFRSDAWRTHGTADVEHSEQLASPDADVYMSWGEQRRDFGRVVHAPKVIKQPQHSHDANYDQLNFFGSSTNVRSGYKQVAVGSAVTTPPSFNDYDEVQPASGEEIRLADDSHLGYAKVRKSKDVNHLFHNDEPYALISKPKRV